MVAVVGRPRTVREEKALKPKHTIFGRGGERVACSIAACAQQVRPHSSFRGTMGWGRGRNEPSIVSVSHGGVNAHVSRDASEDYVGDAPGGEKDRDKQLQSFNLVQGVGGSGVGEGGT